MSVDLHFHCFCLMRCVWEMIMMKGFRENSVVYDLLKLLQNSLTFCMWIQTMEMKLEEYKALLTSLSILILQLYLHTFSPAYQQRTRRVGGVNEHVKPPNQFSSVSFFFKIKWKGHQNVYPWKDFRP